jgi:carbonic anhydrase
MLCSTFTVAGSALDDAPNLKKWRDHARPALAMAQWQSAAKTDLPLHDRVSQSNVLLLLEHLSTYPAVRQGLTHKTLSLAGCWFDIAMGEMQVYDPLTLSFELLNKESIDRLTG